MAERTHRDDTGDGLVLEPKTRKSTRSPRLYRVLLYNDDYTTMDFVVAILVGHFERSEMEAFQLMLQVHLEGVATAGIYPRDVAETKVRDATAEAEAHGMPLMVTAEPEGEGSGSSDSGD